MNKTIIVEGKTTTEAIEKGLQELKTTRSMVDIKILENEDKRSFFSILSPRIVKVEMTLKEKQKNEEINKKRKEIIISEEEYNEAIENLNSFIKTIIEKIPGNNISYNIEKIEDMIEVCIKGEELNYLIGYRGEVLNQLQILLSSIANKNIEKRIRVLVDIEGYREKRKKVLEDLAQKVSKTVVRTKKSITLEPMTAYERKIIHSKLQENNKVTTYSIGEEPYRKIVISLK